MLRIGRDDTSGADFSPCKGDAETGKELNAKVKDMSTIGRQHLRSVTATVHKADHCRSADAGSLFY